MKRTIILNCSYFAAIILMFCFNESYGFPLDESSTERLSRLPDFSNSIYGGLGERHETPAAHSRATREVDNDDSNLIDSSDNSQPKPNGLAFGRPPPGLSKPFGVDHGNVLTPYTTTGNENRKRSYYPIFRLGNPAAVDHGLVLVAG